MPNPPFPSHPTPRDVQVFFWHSLLRMQPTPQAITQPSKAEEVFTELLSYARRCAYLATCAEFGPETTGKILGDLGDINANL